MPDIQIGEQYTINLIADRTGPDRSPMTRIEATMPPELSYISSAPSGTVTGGTLAIVLGAIEVADPPISVTLTVQGEVAGTTNFSMRIITSADDQNQANNVASVAFTVLAAAQAGVSFDAWQGGELPTIFSAGSFDGWQAGELP